MHDIGHLIGARRGLPQMTDPLTNVELGVAGHEAVGERFLADLGFPPSVTAFVRGHVEAKRYLVGKDKGYLEALSEASKGTLECQGGPMTKKEIEEFEMRVDFQVKEMQWDF